MPTLVDAAADKSVPKPIPYYINALLVAIPAVLIGIQVFWWTTCLTSVAHERSFDFRMYYGAAQMMREGHATRLYDSAADTEVQNRTVAPDGEIHLFTHPAYELWMLLPLAYFSFHSSYLILVGVNVVLVWSIYRRILPQLGAFQEMRPWLPFAVFFAFFPIPLAIAQGQDSIVFVLLVVTAFARIRAHDLFSAGVLVGLASFRFQYTLGILALFLVWKAWKFAAGYLASAFACFLLSVAASGWRAQLDYLHLLRLISNAAIPMVNLRGLITALGGSPRLILAASLVVITIVTLIGRRISNRCQFLLAIVATCVTSYHTFGYDLCILILPLAIMMNYALDRQNHRLLTVLVFVMAMPEVLALTLPVARTWLNGLEVLILLVFTCKWVRDVQRDGENYMANIVAPSRSAWLTAES
jgi:hypothetical protein